MSRLPVTRIVLVSLFAASCAGGDPSLPTRGLTPAQLQSVVLLEKEAVFDLGLNPRSLSRRDRVTHGRFRLEEGWFASGPTGQWAVGDRATLSVYVADPEDLSLLIEGKGAGAETTAVLVNDEVVGEFSPTSEWTTHVFDLAPLALHTGVNQIEFTFGFPENRPQQLVLGDPRVIVREILGDLAPTASHLRNRLPEVRRVFPDASIYGDDILDLPGVAAADVIASEVDGGGWQWKVAGDGSLSAEFRTIALVDRSRSALPDDAATALMLDHGAVAIRRSGRLIVPLDSNTLSQTLTFAASAPGGLGRTAELELSVDSDDALDPLATGDLDRIWGRATYAESVDIDELSGPACLVIDIDNEDAGGPVSIESIELEPVPQEPSAPSVEPSPRPDVVLIVLDAARPDHFGCYGYGRDTTPHLDRLAAESLVFTNAYATASYTACSIPTMVSGISFLDHGVTSRREVLADSVTTLAESLQQQGYRTSCYSANPHHAIRQGLAQGCDTFEELWRGRPPEESEDPYLMSAIANERLAEDSDTPQFLLLHYIPPHEPYVPSSEFDLFGRDGYAGEVDGTVRTLQRINRGRIVPTEEDLHELVALYDGNLRMADDAVGRVLETLRRRDRWDETVVLVTSDHGEAFLEHGRVGHNTTVYDEMLRVPFILRIPPGLMSGAPETDRLTSLEDVVPTLLGLTGAPVPDEVTGVDLLSPRTDTGDRAIVARAAHAPRTIAYRTPEWAFIEGRDVLETYNTRSDPGQRRNVYLEEFQRTLCLRALLELELSRPAFSTPERSNDLDQEEIDALRSLGYVR